MLRDLVRDLLTDHVRDMLRDIVRNLVRDLSFYSTSIMDRNEFCGFLKSLTFEYHAFCTKSFSERAILDEF